MERLVNEASYLLDAYSRMLYLLPVIVCLQTFCYVTVTLVLIRRFFLLSVFVLPD